jgi:hypothetical protein
LQTQLSLLNQEPLLPGQTMEALTRVGARVESFRRETGAFPPSLEALPGAESSVSPADVFSPDASPLLYERTENGYRLCSRGPDRLDDRGIELDRLTGRGDLCIGTLR